MTLQEILTEVYENLGEPSDLVGVVTPGQTNQLVDVINRAQLELMAFKLPNGRFVRMRVSEANALFMSAVASGTVGTWSVGARLLTLTGVAGGSNGLKDRLLVGLTSGASALVMASDTVASLTSAYLYRVSGDFTPGETVAVSTREYLWTSVPSGTVINPATQFGLPYHAAEGQPLEIIAVSDADSGVALTRARAGESYSVPATIGRSTPTAFEKIPGGLRLDNFPDTARAYTVRYIRGPKAMVAPDDTPEIPVIFHRGIVLAATVWGLRRSGEATEAYAAHKSLVDFMAAAQTEFELQDAHTPGQIKFYPEGR